MIVEITPNDSVLIEELEAAFSTSFSSKHKITQDFKQNIFTKYFIYQEKSNIIGYVNYYDLYERLEIANIEVKQEYRNKKIGSKLIEYIIQKAEKDKKENITLEVKIDNEYAIKLYKKYGFKTVATRKGYYDGIDGLLMERKMM